MEISKILESIRKTNPSITLEKLMEELRYSSPATLRIMASMAKEG